MKRITTPDVQPFETAHAEVVRKVAPECMVLLKNNGTLPLSAPGKIAVYGSGARSTIKGGTGSGDVNVRKFVTVEEGLENAGFEITTKKWIDDYTKMYTDAKKAHFAALRKEGEAAGLSGFQLVFSFFGKEFAEPEYELPLDGEGDTAIYVLARNSGEGADRAPIEGDINLTKTEIRDILACNKKYKNFALVLNVGGLIDLEPVKEVGTVLLMGQLGIETGNALADVLLGKAYPSGKLTMTWAPINDYPSTEGFGDPNDTYYKEGIYVGYRYFDTIGYEPTFPFGYGMGYTTFTVEPAGLKADGKKVTVMAKVTNTGKCAGKEVVQVYVSAPQGGLDKPYQELKGFVKTAELAPGASETVTVSFDTASMASFCDTCASYVLEAGDYTIRVGNCSRNTSIAGIISLDARAVVAKTKNIAPKTDMKETVPAFKPFHTDCPNCVAGAERISLKASDIPCTEYTYQKIPAEIPHGETIQWSEVTSGKKTVQDFIAGLTDEQLAYLCIGRFEEGPGDGAFLGQSGHELPGAAGETTSALKNLGVPALVLTDGPAGLRLNQKYQVSPTRGPVPMGGAFDGLLSLIFTPEEMKMMVPPPVADLDTSTTFYQYCVAIPIGTALAQSWSEEVNKACGDIIGEEMELFGTESWLAPAMNIYRSPLCGRNFEYYSEDPLVAGKIAAAMTKGVQAHDKCGVTIKHFFCNNQETNRLYSNSVLSERALREIYLKGFEICVREAQPEFLMSSYNLVNGTHACEIRDVQTHCLRDEWGFKGIVMTDWTVTGGLQESHTKYGSATCANNVKAGNDMTQPGGPHDKKSIMDALDDGSLSRAELQVCAGRILESIKKLAMR